MEIPFRFTFTKTYMNEKLISDMTEALIDLDVDRVKTIFTSLFKDNIGSIEGNESILIEAQKQIGDLWEKGDLALSQVYMAGKICDNLISEIVSSEPPSQSKVMPIYTVVLEDFHVLGEKMLISILRMAGYTVIDYGYGISSDSLIQSIKKDKCEILMVSTLMLHSALKIKQLKDKLTELHLNTKLIVGGAPFNIDPMLWKTVGADATASTASKSIELLQQFMGASL